ncbi:MAG: hypothetical protein ABSE17_04615 [Candidatus Levyibacteriota bacterium]
MNKVIPEILVWRNKVTAHFAKTDPREESLATLEASVMFPVNFSKPYLKVGGMVWHSNDSDSELPEWSLTKSFEDLAVRYWPELSIPQFQK